MNILNKETDVELSPSAAFHLRMEKMFHGNVTTTHNLPALPYTPVASYMIFYMMGGAEQTGSDNLWSLQTYQSVRKRRVRVVGKGG